MGVHLIARSGVADSYWGKWQKSFFDDAQERGLHILPVHFYSPVPDARTLDFTEAAVFDKGLDFQSGRAMDTVRELTGLFGDKYREIAGREGPSQKRFTFNGSPYFPGEAEILYGMIRSRRPRRIVEIGSGSTTLLIAEAIRDARSEDSGYACEYVCVDPYRSDYLRHPPAEVSETREIRAQDLTPGDLAHLGDNDLLFIDSSHVVRAQSDVVHEILRLIPTLNPGVLIHLHDIFLPYEYPAKWLTQTRFFWTEQYLLNAYLLENSAIEILLPMHLLSRENRRETQKLFPNMEDAEMPPSAFWMRRV